MINRKISIFILLAIFDMLCMLQIQGQNLRDGLDSIQIIFYNVENLFDANDAESLGDDEFTINGSRRWTEIKYQKKINQISQAVITFASYNFPEIIALAEIENRKVMTDLIKSNIFKSAPYKIIHRESPDRRGIDVGIIYDTTCIRPTYVQFIPVKLNNGLHSRDILYLKALVEKDSLHLFVNHWPSRFSGARNTEMKRLLAAKILLRKCDSIVKNERNAKIILMGDFNDEADDRSAQLLTDHKYEPDKNRYFINLMHEKNNKSGTLKYQGQWFTFDQFIVSNSLLSKKMSSINNIKVSIAKIDFLMQKDQKYFGLKPFRTFNGFKYIGGYSDHLPIKLVLKFEE